MKLIVGSRTAAAAYCVALGLLSIVQGGTTQVDLGLPDNCGTPGALSESSDWNAQLRVSCDSSEASLTAMFTANPSTDDLDVEYTAFIKFNCSNETHTEVSSLFNVFYFSGDTASWTTGLSGSVECVAFGCYNVIEYNRNEEFAHNFAPGNSSVEGTVCSFDPVHDTPSTTLQPSVTLAIVHTPLPEPSSSAGAAVTSSRLIQSSSSIYDSVLGQTVASSPSVAPTAPYPPPLTTAHNWELLMMALAPILVLSCIAVVLGLIIATKHWRKNKQLRNLRTGYGLQKSGLQSKDVYQHIAETFLDIAFNEPQDKYVSTNSIIDLLHFSTMKLDSSKDTESRLESDILDTLTAAMEPSSSKSDITLECNDQPNPPGYIPSLVFSECVTPCNPGPDSSALDGNTPAPPLSNPGSGYIEPLAFTANQVVSNETTTPLSPRASQDDADYVKMCDLVPALLQSGLGPGYDCNSQGYVQL